MSKRRHLNNRTVMLSKAEYLRLFCRAAFKSKVNRRSFASLRMTARQSRYDLNV
jgi:hypothetical protein